MKAVVQRVLSSSVSVKGQQVGAIGKGLTVLLGVGHDDDAVDVEWMAQKLVNLRIFEDENAKMNRSLLDEKGSMLIISQFTLFGDCEKGRRPSFTGAGEPGKAKALYEAFIQAVEALGVPTASGIFQADMQVSILNDGPVTLIVETPPRQKKLAKGTMSHLNLPPKEQEKFDEEAAHVRRNLQLRKQQKG